MRILQLSFWGVAMSAFAASTLVPSAVGQSTWVGPASGSWNNVANWDSGDVPNAATESAIVGAPSPVNANLNVDLASLMVEADGVVDVQGGLNFDFSGMEANSLANLGIINIFNNADFQFQGVVVNAGDITVNSAGNLTDIEVDGMAQLSGGGTITLGGNLNARLMGINNAILMIDDQTIQGFGQIGVNSLALELSANTLINANSTGNAILIDGNAALGAGGFGVVNGGTLRASNGGLLRFGNDIIDNQNGVIEALAGANIRLENGATIVGGLLRSTGDGQIAQLAGSNVFLEALTLDADLQTENNSDLGITGVINNTGNVAVVSAGNLTDIEVQTDGATLTGGGTVTLAGGINARVMGTNSMLTIQDQTIEGIGQLGANTIFMEFTSDAVVDANVAGQALTIDGNAALNTDGFGTVNSGTMQATGGGILRFTNDEVDNSNGVIEALAGSTVRLENGTTIVGGTVRSLDDGQVIQVGGSNVFLQDLTLEADVLTENNSDFGIVGNIENQGTITVASAGNLTDIEVQAAGSTLTGGGTINLTGSVNARLMGVNSQLVVSDQTIQGRGQIGANTIFMQFDADTLVNANVAGETLAVDGNAALNVDGFGTINDGTIRASAGGILQIGNDDIDNRNGVVEALAGSSVRLENGARIVGGLLSSAGDGQITQTGGTNVFVEDLTINADLQVENNADFGVTGTINNLGTISINSVGNITELEIQADGATITGSGNTILSEVSTRIGGFAPLVFEEGTLSGIGQVSVDSTFNGATISPGLSVGGLQFNGDSMLTGGTIMNHEIQSVVENPGVNADIIDVDGELNLDGVVIKLVSLDANGDPGLIQDFDPNSTHKFLITIADGIGISNGVVVDSSEFANNVTGVFSKAIQPRGSREALIIRYGEFALADVNRDGAVNLLDVAPFIEVLNSGDFTEEADVNCDGAVNLLDVSAFIDALNG